MFTTASSYVTILILGQFGLVTQRMLMVLGFYSIKKGVKVLTVFFSLVGELLFHRPRFVYFQVSPLGVAFYRDLFFISLNKLFRVKILCHQHGKGIKKASKTKWKKQLYKFAFKGQSVICLSHLLTNNIEDVYHGQTHRLKAEYVVHDENGYMASAFDIEEMIKAIKTFLYNTPQQKLFSQSAIRVITEKASIQNM